MLLPITRERERKTVHSCNLVIYHSTILTVESKLAEYDTLDSTKHLYHRAHVRLQNITSPNLINFLWTVFITAHHCTIDMWSSLEVFLGRVNWADQVLLTIASTQPEDALLYLLTAIK